MGDRRWRAQGRSDALLALGRRTPGQAGMGRRLRPSVVGRGPGRGPAVGAAPGSDHRVGQGGDRGGLSQGELAPAAVRVRIVLHQQVGHGIGLSVRPARAGMRVPSLLLQVLGMVLGMVPLQPLAAAELGQDEQDQQRDGGPAHDGDARGPGVLCNQVALALGWR